jgi:hypothetical protein
MDFIAIQLQDQSGNWRTYNQTQNIPSLIRQRMEELKRQFPDLRVRAVDNEGRLVDML